MATFQNVGECFGINGIAILLRRLLFWFFPILKKSPTIIILMTFPKFNSKSPWKMVVLGRLSPFLPFWGVKRPIFSGANLLLNPPGGVREANGGKLPSFPSFPGPTTPSLYRWNFQPKDPPLVPMQYFASQRVTQRSRCPNRDFLEIQIRDMTERRNKKQWTAQKLCSFSNSLKQTHYHQ